MQHIFDIHDYDENFAERFCNHTIPIYDLWSVRPLQNQMKEIISGTSEETEKFRNFLIDHANKDYPHELIIVIGNGEKSNPGNMLNSTKKYFKLRFDKFKGNDLGQPLYLGSAPYPTGQEQMMPLSFPGFPSRPQAGNSNFGGIAGLSYQDLQGIIDKNVSDATRSIKAEYDEISAKRETDSIKRIAELEMRMELYKLELRAKEIEEKERKLLQELEEFEERKAEGLGTVKEYTKSIAGGLFELGKSAFGLDEADKIVKKSFKKNDLGSAKNDTKASEPIIDDDDFAESPEQQKSKSNISFDELIGAISNMTDEQKMYLMDVLIPEDEIEEEKQTSEQTNEIVTKKAEEDENIQISDND